MEQLGGTISQERRKVGNLCGLRWDGMGWMVSGVKQDRAGHLVVLSIAVRLHLGAVLLSGEGCADHFSSVCFPDSNCLLIFLFLCFSSPLSSNVTAFCSAALCSINARAQSKVLSPLA